MQLYILLFLLSTINIGRIHGIPKFERAILKEIEYENGEVKNNYIHNENERQVHSDYNPWEYEDDKEDSHDSQHIEYLGDSTKGKYSRRLYEWLSRLFKTTTTKDAQTTVTTESTYTRELRERIFLRALHSNLTDVLKKLTDVEKRVSVAMDQKEAYSILTKGKPQVIGLDSGFYYGGRFKREVADKEKNETRDLIKEKKEESITKKSVMEKLVKNSTKKVTDNVDNTTECPCDKNITSGRRTASILVTPTEVKNKLLSYLQESFEEIKSKIKSLQNLKQTFSDNVSFKIGYILANIDTLEVNMINLKDNMDRNKDFWEDNKILDLYDTLKVSNQAVSGLIESMKLYLEQLHQMHSQSETSFG